MYGLAARRLSVRDLARDAVHTDGSDQSVISTFSRFRGAS